MFIQKPKPEHIDKATEKLRSWLTIHNLSNGSVPLAWLIATLPAIAVAHFRLPLALVLLVSIVGFVGLWWAITQHQPASASDCGKPNNGDIPDPGLELLRENRANSLEASQQQSNASNSNAEDEAETSTYLEALLAEDEDSESDRTISDSDSESKHYISPAQLEELQRDLEELQDTEPDPSDFEEEDSDGSDEASDIDLEGSEDLVSVGSNASAPYRTGEES